jgi:hypothetical protein
VEFLPAAAPFNLVAAPFILRGKFQTVAFVYPNSVRWRCLQGDQVNGFWEQDGGFLMRCDSSDTSQKAVSRQHPLLFQQRSQPPIVLTIGIAVGLLVGFSVRSPQTGSANRQAVDAAFRDGMFQAKLDVESGRKPHVDCGRWNSNADRALFIAGYQQEYREAFETHAGKLPKPAAAEVAGYRDGLLEGVAHLIGSHSFQPDKTDNYLNAGQDSLQPHQDAAKYQREYRLAYLNGYQQGYYSQETSSQWSYYSQEQDNRTRTDRSDLAPTSK